MKLRRAGSMVWVDQKSGLLSLILPLTAQCWECLPWDLCSADWGAMCPSCAVAWPPQHLRRLVACCRAFVEGSLSTTLLKLVPCSKIVWDVAILLLSCDSRSYVNQVNDLCRLEIATSLSMSVTGTCSFFTSPLPFPSIKSLLSRHVNVITLELI